MKGRRFQVFLGYQFKSTYHDRSLLLSTLESAVDVAEEDLQRFDRGLTLELVHKAIEIGKPLGAQIIESVRQSTVAFFDVSDRNPNVMFEIGLAYGSDMLLPAMLYSHGEAKAIPVASDVAGFLRIDYPRGRINRVEGRIASHIVHVVKRNLMVREDDRDAQLRRLWRMPGNRVHIACPEIPRPRRPKFAETGSTEYVSLARYGDTDTLLEVLTLIDAVLPRCHVSWSTWKQARAQDQRENLIILGGPDYNGLTRTFMKTLRVPVRYSYSNGDDCFKDSMAKREFSPTIRRRRVIEDFGLFVRCPNPLNPKALVIMIGGLTTFGVLGTLRSFSPNQIGRWNAKAVLGRAGRLGFFSVLVPTQVTSQQPVLGKVDVASLHGYPWARD